MATRFDCALYDGLYIALSALVDAPLVHADDKLRNILGGRYAHELWIDDFEVS